MIKKPYSRCFRNDHTFLLSMINVNVMIIPSMSYLAFLLTLGLFSTKVPSGENVAKYLSFLDYSTMMKMSNTICTGDISLVRFSITYL